MSFYVLLALFALLLLRGAAAQLYSTGLSNANTVQAYGTVDTHWVWSTGGGSMVVPAASWGPATLFIANPWWLTLPSSSVAAAWLGNSNAPTGWMSFKTTFSNPNALNTTVVGAWSCDNNLGALIVNGVAFSTLRIANAFSTLYSFNFTVPAGPATVIFTCYNESPGFGGAAIVFRNVSLPCPAGSFVNLTSMVTLAATCSPCAAGTFGNITAASACWLCPAGSFSSAGASSCTLCPAGTFTASAGSSSCQLCPIGAYCAGGAALNVSCYPVTACTVEGLSAQPPCYWNVSTLAGTGASGFIDGAVSTSQFNNPIMITISTDNSTIYIADSVNHRIRALRLSNFTVSTVAGTGAVGSANGIASTATFNFPYGVADGNNSLWIGDYRNHLIRKITAGVVSTFAGGGGATNSGSNNGIGTSARFFWPLGLSMDTSSGILYVADYGNNLVRQIFSSGQTSTIGTSASFNSPYHALFSRGVVFITDQNNHRIQMINTTSGSVTILAGSGVAGSNDGNGALAKFKQPMSIAVAFNTAAVADWANQKIRFIDTVSGFTRTVAGAGTVGFTNNFGMLAAFNYPSGVVFTNDGNLVIADQTNHAIRKLTCVPCPASYYCSSGAPVLCPAGSFCPLSSINATLCPAGSFSSAGASSCTLCPAGTFTASAGSSSCQLCPAGHYCPTGSSSWNDKNCGRGNYCPWGSAAPISCGPKGAFDSGLGPANGPAFDSDVAACKNHCYFGAPGQLSTCG